jgi:Asp-tRNA(Asn)/Glu-tRNA(Gln) amidotransferase A subunit family amidase
MLAHVRHSFRLWRRTPVVSLTVILTLAIAIGAKDVSLSSVRDIVLLGESYAYHDAFTDFDLVVLPTRRRTPRTIDAAIKREENDKPMNPELENTGQFNVYGIPAISVPCGFTPSGLPVGLMIAGPRFSEARVLALANAYERATDWHTRKPPLKPDSPVPALKPTDETP